MASDVERQRRIAELNDRLRRSLGGDGGRMVMTEAIDALPSYEQAIILQKVATFSEFNEDNDPHGEHDFGGFRVGGHHVFWKIDYYDERMEYGSEDPGDPTRTTRLLTIMLAEDY